MQLTIETALKEIAILSRAEVVAGSGGLNRPLYWTHIVELPDVMPWVREGDLLLTTAYSLKDDPEAQARLIPDLARKGLAGMVVALGPYFSSVPDVMLEVANQLDFPILTLPWEVPFVEVTQAIHEQIVSEQYRLIDESLHIHKVLTNLVLEGKGFEDLVTTLANLLNRSVTIEDASLRVLAHASPGLIDEMRQRSIAEGQTPQELIDYLEAKGLFAGLLRDPKPLYVPSIPEMGMTLERLIAPILVGTQLYGYVWIIATERSLTELDFITIERVATVAALTFTRQQAIFEAEQRLKANLLDNLLDLDPYYDIRQLTETLRQLGIQRGYHVLILEACSQASERGETVQDPLQTPRIAQTIERVTVEYGAQATVIQRGQRLIVLLGIPESRRAANLANSILEHIQSQYITVVGGLSSMSSEASELRRCYKEASEALRLGSAMSVRQPQVWQFEDLGFLHWLSNLPPEILVANRYYSIVRAIHAEDRTTGSNLLNTIETLLEQQGNKQKAAQALFVHRNTLSQRLRKISDIWGIDLDDSFTLINLHIAIKEWRLSRG
jgi:PucR family transcriptional regulator, purine catabolism regulatory protein